MRKSGQYGIRHINPGDKFTEFLIYKLSPRQLEQRVRWAEQASEVKPPESAYFKTGELFNFFSAKDLDRNKFTKSSLQGKVVVINFWFINCPPCRKEIPELNKLTKEYADSNVVFLAVATDSEESLRNFLKTTEYSYHIIPFGRDIAGKYGVRSYPTNLVVDTQGRVQFHSTGLRPGTITWIKKAIESSLKATSL
jgi:thiol-disulfide isomerase/thioredoxin